MTENDFPSKDTKGTDIKPSSKQEPVSARASYTLKGPSGKTRVLDERHVELISRSTSGLSKLKNPVDLVLDVDPDVCVSLMDRILDGSEHRYTEEELMAAEALCLEEVLPRMRMTCFSIRALLENRLDIDCLRRFSTDILAQMHAKGEVRSVKDLVRSWNCRPHFSNSSDVWRPEDYSLTYIKALGTNAVFDHRGVLVIQVNSDSAKSIKALLTGSYPSLTCDVDNVGAVSLIKVSGENVCEKVEACLHRSRLASLPRPEEQVSEVDSLKDTH